MTIEQDNARSPQKQPSQVLYSNAEQNLRHIVAGILSTTTFIPSERHPESMLPIAGVLIKHIREMDNHIGETVTDDSDISRNLDNDF